MEKNLLGDIESAFAFLDERSGSAGLSREMVPLLRYCGIERCLPGHGFGPGEKDYYLIHCILDGHGIYDYHGEKFRLGRGQSFLIYPEEPVFYQADYAEPWKYCWFAFCCDDPEEFVRKIGFTRNNPVCTFPDMDMIEKKVSEILSHRGDAWEDLCHREGTFLLLMEDLLRQGARNGNSSGEENRFEGLELGTRTYTAQAIHYLETHFRERIRIRDLAHEIGISRSYLTQQVKEAIGVSPRTLLINIRMEHALKYLETSNDPIQLVALECGYDDALAFSKAFKERFGMSPSKYRKENRKPVRMPRHADETLLS